MSERFEGKGRTDNDAKDEEEDDFFIDDSPLVVNRVKKLFALKELKRVHAVRDFVNVFQSSVQDGMDVVVPLLGEALSDRTHKVRENLAEQLGLISAFLLKTSIDSPDTLSKQTAKEIIQESLFPVVGKLLTDSQQPIRVAAATAVMCIWQATIYEAKQLEKLGGAREGQSIGSSLVDETVLPLLQTLCDSTEEEQRVAAADLITQLIPLIEKPRPTVIEHLKQMIIKAASDVMFRVRRSVAMATALLSHKLPADDISTHMLPIFVRLSKDEIWAVRKACAEAVLELSANLHPTERVSELAPIFLLFLEDKSRWVRSSAASQLGPFITSFNKPDEKVPDELLTAFLSMADANCKFGDADTPMFCAFSFPGVLITLGRDSWPQLKEFYNTLVKNFQWKVRKSLSHSIHEVAKILGNELTEAELIGAFDLFLKDLDNVKVGAIKNLAQFLSFVSVPIRKNYIETITEIQAESVNWRFRKLISKQLGLLVTLYDQETIENQIIPIILQLCEDQVTTVRKAVTSSMADVLVNLNIHSPQTMENFIQQILAFSTRESCYDRQTFAMMCENFVTKLPAEMFATYFLRALVNMAQDRIPNVRFIVARTVSQHLVGKEAFKDFDDLINNVHTLLLRDKDLEVRFYAQLVLPSDPVLFRRQQKALNSSSSLPMQ